MSSEQTSAHPRSLRERIAVIRQNSATLRKRVTGTVGRSGLGWKGESARQELAASLRVHFAQTDGDGKGDIAHTNQVKSHECDDGDTDKTKGDHKQRDQEKGCGRSDSMEPLKDTVVQEDGKTSYAGWHSLNSGMMRKKKLEELQGMYSSGGRFATIEPDKGRALQDVSSFADDAGDENGMTFSSHHLGDGDNPGLSSNPHPENDYLIPDHAFPSTLDLVRNKPEELYRDYSYAENQYSSGPYPSSPPTSHPQPPSSPSRAPSSRSPIALSPVPSKFSVWPSTRAISPIAPFSANQDCSSPATISYSSTTAAIVSSSTVPFRSPSLSARPDLQHSNSNSAGKGGKRWNKDGGGERDDDCDIEYPPDHPLYGLDTLQRRSYWDELSSYRSNSPRLALKNAPLALQQDSRGRDSPDSWSQVQFGLLGSAAQSYRETLAADIERTFFEILGPEARILVRDMMNAMSEPTTRSMGVVSEEALSVAVPIEVEQEGRSKKTSGAGKLCQSLTCRSGATSPDGPARSVDPELQSADVAAMPKKFGMTYLTRKMRSDPTMWKKYKDKQRKIREATRDEVIAANGENARHDAGTERQNIELQPMPQSSPQELETPISKSGVETPKSDAHSDVAPPVQLSKAIQREPESIISSSPVAGLPSLPGPTDPSPAPREPARERAITRIRAASQPPQSAQQKSESSRSSLSERLRATRLEDLRLQSETAQEIRELMLDLDRDRSQSLSKATASRHRPTLSELPGGFTSTSSTESRSQRSKSPRGALERHFQTLQEANEEARLRGQTSLRSQSSNLTLPRSYKAPATHSYAPLPQSRASTSVTEDTNAEDDEVTSAQSSSTAVDNRRYERQKDDGEKEDDTPRDAELSTQREES